MAPLPTVAGIQLFPPAAELEPATWPPPGIRKCPRCVEEVAKRQEPEPEEQAGEEEAEQTAD